MLAELIDLAPGGVEEVELESGVIEYAVYGAPGELPELPALTAAAGTALVEISSREVPEGWRERWREFHRPLVLGSRLTVRPPWEPARETELDLVIDPGRAFGTGAHATTQLCLELLLELDPGGSFADLGCGSGVLAIAAARLGYSPVIALDNDPVAVEVTLENARVNGVTLDQVRRVDLRSDPPPAARTVAANLLGPLLVTLADRLAEEPAAGAARLVVAPKGPSRLIASGLLVDEAAGVAAAFGRAGLRATAHRERGEWAALLLLAQPSGDGPGQSPLAG